MSLRLVAKLSTVNFPSDREYTHNALIEELVLLEKHLRDESWRLCSCNSEKHLPAIAGLGSEGQGFSETKDEKEFMRSLQVQARIWKDKIKKGSFNEKDADTLRAFARESRHRIEAKNWSGEWERFEVGEKHSDIMLDVKRIIGELKNGSHVIANHVDDALDFLVMEKKMAEEVIAKLSKEHGVDPPELVISDKCHEPDIGLYTDNQILLCKTGINLHVLIHEFYHHIQAKKGMHLDEGEAENFAIELFTPQIQKPLYAIHAHSHSERILTLRSVSKLDIKDVGVVYGGDLLGYSAGFGLKFLDTMRPEGWMGQPLSFWGDILGAAGGVIGALYLKAPYNLLSALVGGYLATELVNHIIRIATPIAQVALPPTVFTNQVVFGSTPEPTAPTPVVVGRYIVA